MQKQNEAGADLLPSAAGDDLRLPENAALIVVDMQQAFSRDYWEHWGGPGGVRNNPEAEKVVGTLLGAWRASARPVIHIKHDSVNPRSPLRPEHPGNAFSSEVLPQPGEPVYSKHVNSGFIGTTLEQDLRDRGIDTLVITGIQTNHCVSTTARMAGNLGFNTYVVSDGTATFDREGPDGVRYPADLMHATALATLHDEFATIVSSQALLHSAAAPATLSMGEPAR